jgi:drug/metabolite transporter superfamily protein YnfA
VFLYQAGPALILKTLAILVLAAVLEVGGLALVRIGLHSYGYPLAAGAFTLVAYGVMVNQSSVDFNRLMGIYIAVFFVVSQAISLILFKQIPDDRIILGGGFIVAGGLLILLMT